MRQIQGYLAPKKQPPPQDHHRALGMVLLLGPRGALFLMREVPLYHPDMPGFARDVTPTALILCCLWEGYRESRICARDTYPGSYITKYTLV